MKVAIGSDHAGYRLKQVIISFLRESGYDVEDVGCMSEASCDYPDFAYEVARRVASGECDRGILICGTGIGMAIAANKVKGVRAAVVHDVTTARLAKEHNNANVITFGGRIVGVAVALDIVKTWLSAKFDISQPRHQRRVDKIAKIEEKWGELM